MILDFREYLTEVKQNQLYKEFLKVQKNPHQLELALDFKDELFTNKQEIARHILRQLNFISIGFEFEMYLMKQHGGNSGDTISLEDIDSDILYNAHKYFDFDDDEKLSNIRDDYYDAVSDNIRDEFESLDINEVYEEYEGHEPEEEIEKNSEEYDNLYEQWRQDNMDNFYYDLTFEDYIDKIYSNLSEFAGSIGLSYLNEDYLNYEFDGNDLVSEDNKEAEYETLSELLEKKLGIDCRIFNNYHQSKKNSKHFWYIEPDTSLDEEDSTYFPVEIVTKTYPAYKYKEVFNSLFKVLNDENYHPVANNSTGLHFSISFNDKIANESIDPLKLIILGQDSFFLKKLGRNFNRYCHSQFKNVLRRIQELTLEYGLLEKEVIENEDIIEKLKDEIRFENKYSAINFSKYQVYDEHGDDNKNRFIEFRITGNDYIVEFKKEAIRTIDWFLFIIIAASSKKLLQNEYYDKIKELSRMFVNSDS